LFIHVEEIIMNKNKIVQLIICLLLAWLGVFIFYHAIKIALIWLVLYATALIFLGSKD
jgi:hypothetical protein